MPAYLVKIENFLAPDLHRGVKEYILASEGKFGASTIVTETSDSRRSRVLSEFPMAQLFWARLAQSLDPVCDALEIPRIPHWLAELEIVATEDGGFYRPHTDTGVGPELGSVDGPAIDGLPHVRRRVLSYVYYVQAEPRPFEGGSLRIHAGSGHTDIEPTGNSIVLFPSGMWHEVLPTHVPSRKFGDSRFTINGWVRRSPARPV